MPLGHHMQPVADFKQFVQLLTDHQHSAARIAQRQNRAANLRSRAHVHPPGGLRNDEQLGIGVDLTPHDELLQVAARQRLGRGMGATGLHIEAPDDVLSVLLQRPDLDPAAAADRVSAREQQVVRQAHGGHGATAQALLGHKVQAQSTALGRPHTPRVLACDLDAGRSGALVFARQCVQQLLLPIARHPGNAHHFARLDLELHVNQVHAKLVGARQRQVLHPQHRGTGLRRAVLQRRRLGANHQARQGGVGFFRRVTHPGDLAAPQHGASSAQRANFVQLVADVENAAALGRQLAQHHKELFDRLGREHRSGLVQDQQLGVGEQGADDFHALHLAHTQGVHRAQGVDVEAVFGGLGGNAAGHFGQRLALVQAQPYVFGHREGVEQAEMLEHHGNTQGACLLRVAHLHGLAVEVHAAFVGLDRAIDDFHQRGLARAVFAQHGVDLAGLHRQRHTAVGHHGRVALGDARQLQPWRRRTRR